MNPVMQERVVTILVEQIERMHGVLKTKNDLYDPKVLSQLAFLLCDLPPQRVPDEFYVDQW